MTGPIVYRGAGTDLRLDSIVLNGRPGALMLWDAAADDDWEDADDLATFQDAETAAAWLADLVRAARDAGIDLAPAAAELDRGGLA